MHTRIWVTQFFCCLVINHSEVFKYSDVDHIWKWDAIFKTTWQDSFLVESHPKSAVNVSLEEDELEFTQVE